MMTETKIDPSVTILMGSGASVDLGFPSTAMLTESTLALGTPVLRSPRPPYAETPMMLLLKRALLGSYNELNFELILHGLETLATLAKLEGSTPDSLRPAFAAFCDVTPRLEELLNYEQLQTLAHHVLHCIVESIRKASESFDRHAAERVLLFFKQLGEERLLRIFTLNYDNMLESSGVSGFDGFVDGVFEAGTFAQNWGDQNLLCHLHGSILFGVERDNAFPRIKKYPTPGDASARILWERVITQSREEVFIGPIISGLRKSEKLLFQPYSSYYSSLVNSLISSPRIVLIGYGWGDTYINHWLINARELHGPDLKVAMVTKASGVEDLVSQGCGQFFALMCNRNDVQQLLNDVRRDEFVFATSEVMLISDGDAYAHGADIKSFLG